MIANDIKSRIVAAMAANRQNYNSDRRHATMLGIKPSVYSEVKKGNYEKQLSDGAWVSLARKLQVNLGNEPEWVIVKTPTFEYITTQLKTCQERSLSGIFCDKTDIGKTVAAQHYAKNNRHVVYVDCGQVKTKQRLIRYIAREFGIDATGRYTDVYDDLVSYLRILERPLVILDEAGDLQYDAFLELKAIWNATEHFCGWYQLGADALKEKIDKGIERRKVGFAEMKSRYGNKYSKITPEDAKEREGFLFKQAELIARANAPAGANIPQIVRKSGGSPRDVWKIITKPQAV